MDVENFWTSEKFGGVMKALAKFQTLVLPVIKDAENPHFRKKYADLSAVQEAIAGPLYESGLSYTQHPKGRGEVLTILHHEETGEWMASLLDLVPDTATAQQSGSAITYSKRYALCSILGLRLDSDDDGNTASQASQKQVRDEKAAKATKANATRTAAAHKVTDTFRSVYERMEAYEPSQGAAKAFSLKVLGANGYESFKHVEKGSKAESEIIGDLMDQADVWKKEAELNLQPSDAEG